MKCPNCKKKVIIPIFAILNLESYNVGGTVLVASECCDTGYIVQMNVSYKVTLYTGDEKTDGWGKELKKPK